MNKILLWSLLTALFTGNSIAAPTLSLQSPLRFPVPPIIFPIPFVQPDLVVTDFNRIGPVTVRADGFQEVPVRVVIENQGNGTAGKFRVSARYITSQGDFMRPFTVVGQSNMWRPTTMASMFPGETVALEGKLLGYPSTSGVTVDFYIKADSCDSDEFMPNYCRVNESNETNNDSDVITVFLP
jgi:hypothetical protein